MIHPVHGAAYAAFIAREVVAGACRVAGLALRGARASRPAIVELPLRCRTDLEVTAMASSITITPGTLVVGIAAAEGETPPTLFVHSLFEATREEALEGLRDMETRLLRATRGTRRAGGSR